jgi:hypothetical protein
LRWELGARKNWYLYKRGLCTDQASDDLMEIMASCFYGRVRDLVLEGLIGKVWKSKKPMDDQNAGASDGH